MNNNENPVESVRDPYEGLRPKDKKEAMRQDWSEISGEFFSELARVRAPEDMIDFVSHVQGVQRLVSGRLINSMAIASYPGAEGKDEFMFVGVENMLNKFKAQLESAGNFNARTLPEMAEQVTRNMFSLDDETVSPRFIAWLTSFLEANKFGELADKDPEDQYNFVKAFSKSL